MSTATVNKRIVKRGAATLPYSPIPKSWYAMAGAFKHKRKALERYAKAIRKEWGK